MNYFLIDSWSCIKTYCIGYSQLQGRLGFPFVHWDPSANAWSGPQSCPPAVWLAETVNSWTIALNFVCWSTGWLTGSAWPMQLLQKWTKNQVDERSRVVAHFQQWFWLDIPLGGQNPADVWYVIAVSADSEDLTGSHCQSYHFVSSLMDLRPLELQVDRSKIVLKVHPSLQLPRLTIPVGYSTRK